MKNVRKVAIILLPIVIAIVSVGLWFLSTEIVRNREQNKDTLKQFEFSVNEDGLTLTKINYIEGNELIIPEEYFDKKVTEVSVDTVSQASVSEIRIEKLVVPASVKRLVKLGNGSNRLSHLKEVVFEENSQLEYIGEYVFSETQLTEITIPKKVNRLGDSAFSLSKLEKVVFEEGNALRSVAPNAFSGNIKLKEIDLPETVEKIEYGAFAGCGFETVWLSQSESLKILEKEAFFGNPLELVFIPKTLVFIGENALTAKNSDKFTTRLVFEKGVSRDLIDLFPTKDAESGATVRVIYDNALALLEREGVYYVRSAEETATAVYAEAQNEVKIDGSVLGVRVKTVGTQLLSGREYMESGVSGSLVDSVRINMGVTRIESEAFVSCGASQANNVYVPAGIDYVGQRIGGDYIRLGDSETTTAYADGWNEASKGVAFGYNGYKTSGNGIEYVTDSNGVVVLRVKSGAKVNEYGIVEIPSLLEDKNVYRIADYACVDKMLVFIQRNVQNVEKNAIGRQCVALYEEEALSDTLRSIGGCDRFGSNGEYTYAFTVEGELIVLAYTGEKKTVRLDQIVVSDRSLTVIGFIDYAFDNIVEEVFYRQGIRLYGESNNSYHEYLS